MSRTIHVTSSIFSFFLIACLATSSHAAGAAKDGGKDKSPAKVAVLEISGSYPEGPDQDGLFGEISVSLNKVLERIDQVIAAPVRASP